MRNLTHTGWNGPLIRAWLVLATFSAILWIAILWGAAHLIARLLA